MILLLLSKRFLLHQQLLHHSLMRRKKGIQSHLSSVTAFTRAKNVGNEFYEDKGVLFCRVCVKAINHKSLTVIKGQQNSEKHFQNYLISSSNRKQPLTLTTSFAVACVASNIPLNVPDNLIMRNFFQRHLTSGVLYQDEKHYSPI